jgi:hypothetical protein
VHRVQAPLHRPHALEERGVEWSDPSEQLATQLSSSTTDDDARGLQDDTWGARRAHAEPLDVLLHVAGEWCVENWSGEDEHLTHCLAADDKNLPHLLEYALLRTYMRLFYKHSLMSEALKPGWPRQSAGRALGLWIGWLGGGEFLVRLEWTCTDEITSLQMICRLRRRSNQMSDSSF